MWPGPCFENGSYQSLNLTKSHGIRLVTCRNVIFIMSWCTNPPSPLLFVKIDFDSKVFTRYRATRPTIIYGPDSSCSSSRGCELAIIFRVFWPVYGLIIFLDNRLTHLNREVGLIWTIKDDIDDERRWTISLAKPNHAGAETGSECEQGVMAAYGHV